MRPRDAHRHRPRGGSDCRLIEATMDHRDCGQDVQRVLLGQGELTLRHAGAREVLEVWHRRRPRGAGDPWRRSRSKSGVKVA